MDIMVGAVIQARLSSTRLPGKVLLDIEGKTMLARVIDRVKMASKIDKIIVATTTSRIDDLIVNSINSKDVSVFRGEEYNVLSRFYHAAKNAKINTIVRISADCPLIDPKIIDKVIEKFFEHNVSIATNSGGISYQRTFPVGLDVEVISFNALEQAHFNSTENYEKEHVTPFIYKNDENIFYLESESLQSDYRFTVDTREDMDLIQVIYNHFCNKKIFYLEEIMTFLRSNEHLTNINKHVKQKSYLEVQSYSDKPESLLIIGSTGMLGNDITLVLKSNFTIYTLNRNKDENFSIDYSFQCDFNNHKEVSSLLLKIKPNIIVLTAAMVDIDYCENNPILCMDTNYFSVVNLLNSIHPDTLILFISSDAVFDDSKMFPKESDEKNPLNVYSKSKSMAEDYLISNHSNHIIIRTNMYGFHKNWRGSLVEWALDKIRKNIPTGGFIDVHFNPLYTKQIAHAVHHLLKHNFRGIIHLGSETSVSKYEFLVRVANGLGYDSNLIFKTKLKNHQSTVAAKRPKMTSLNTDKAKSISDQLDYKLDNGIALLIEDLKEYWSKK